MEGSPTAQVEVGTSIKCLDAAPDGHQSDVLEAACDELDRLLSRANVTTDPTVTSLMLNDWSIPASALTAHPSLSHFGLSPENLLRVAADSSIVRANFESMTITPELSAKRNVLILRSLPPDVTAEELKGLLLQKTQTVPAVSPAVLVEGVASNSDGDDVSPQTPSTAQSSSAAALPSASPIRNIRLDSSGYWYVTFADEESTQDFAVWLRSQRFRNGDYFRVAIRNSRCLESSLRPPRAPRGPVFFSNSHAGRRNAVRMKPPSAPNAHLGGEARRNRVPLDNSVMGSPANEASPRKATPRSSSSPDVEFTSDNPAAHTTNDASAAASSPGVEDTGVCVMSTGGHEQNLNSLKVFPISIAASGGSGAAHAMLEPYEDGQFEYCHPRPSPQYIRTGVADDMGGQIVDEATHHPTSYPYYTQMGMHYDRHYGSMAPMKQENGAGHHVGRTQADRRPRNRNGPAGAEWNSRAMWRNSRRGAPVDQRKSRRLSGGSQQFNGLNNRRGGGGGGRNAGGDSAAEGTPQPYRGNRSRMQRQPQRSANNGVVPNKPPASNGSAKYVPDDPTHFPSLSESVELHSSPSSGTLKKTAQGASPRTPTQHFEMHHNKKGTSNGRGGRGATNFTLGDHLPVQPPCESVLGA